MIVLLLVGVLAQGADAATMRFSHEANPLVLWLGPQAYLAKMLLILGATALAWALPRLSTRSRVVARQRVATLISLIFLASGLVGVLSNLLARGSL